MAMDQQTVMERLKELYREKNEHLERFLEPVTPFEFYRDIFPVGSFERKGHFEDEKGNGIAVTVPKAAGIAMEIKGDGKARRYTITDELSELSEVFDTDFTIMSPLSYFGRRRCGKNARYLYAMVFDLDGVEMPQLRDTLHQMNKDILPQATFVVNSGTGLHLYYVLKEFGLKVSSLYISQVKRKCGIEVGENYNLPKSENARVPQCPKEKEDAIKAALKYYAMI